MRAAHPTPAGVATPKPKAATPESIASKLTARDRVILFCAATGTDHAAIGITARAMQAMAVRGLIQRDRGGVYVLTPTGRAMFAAALERAGVDYPDRSIVTETPMRRRP
jgi:hypothetical protein